MKVIIISESLLVIPTVGIQSSVKYVCGKEDNFVPWSCIDDVIINEVIKLVRINYFVLAFECSFACIIIMLSMSLGILCHNFLAVKSTQGQGQFLETYMSKGIVLFT